ncbi:unnamed protein product, partial [Symbiodinium sp. CCMP2456]
MAYEDFVSWTREHKLEHTQPEFKPSNMRDSATGYAELSMKGHNARVVTAWLAHRVLQIYRDRPELRSDNMKTMVKAVRPRENFEAIACICSLDCPLQAFRYWLAEFFNRMERYGKYMQMEERNGLVEASDIRCISERLVFMLFVFPVLVAYSSHDCCFLENLLIEDKFGVAYAALAKQAARTGDLLWLLRPKMH